MIVEVVTTELGREVIEVPAGWQAFILAIILAVGFWICSIHWKLENEKLRKKIKRLKNVIPKNV